MKAADVAGASRRELEERLEALEKENAKLRTIRDALIERMETAPDFRFNGYSLVLLRAEAETGVEKRIQRMARAVSEAKIARRQLQQSIDSLREGFILYDSKDRIVLCNRTYRTMFPELADLLQPGTCFGDLIRRAAECGVVAEAVTDPQAWIALREHLHRSECGQFQQMLSDGRWIDISERSTEEGGKVTIVSDISRFRHEEGPLASVDGHSAFLARVVASIAQGVAVIDKELRLATWNSQAAMLLNLPYVEIRSGMDVRDLLKMAWRRGVSLSPERKKEVRDWINSPNRRHPMRIELDVLGGRCVAANFRDMPRDGFVVTMTDVTAQIKTARLLEASNEELERHVAGRTRELRELNATLEGEIRRHRDTAADLARMRTVAEAASISKTRFLAAASHDLLQPLNAAQLYLSALETSPFLDPAGRELVDNIVRAFKSIETLLSALLDISKMDAGGYHPKLAAVALGDLFDTLRTEFGAMARQKGVRLRIVPTSLILRSDARLLRSVVQNLLSNAVKYTDSGSVLLGVRRRGNAVVIEVYDTGPGIAADDQQVIFEEFRRLKAARPVGGLGLGLATVRRAASLLGYGIAVRSEVGRGTCFSVLIPEAREHMAAPANLPAAQARQPERSGPGCVFLLENDEEVADAMAMLFERWKLESVTAGSYRELLATMRSRRLEPQVVIADLDLDDELDGIEAIELLRREIGFDVPGVLTTADQSRDIQERARAAGIEYFSKPLKPAQLRAYLLHLTPPGPGRSPARD